MAPKAAVDSVDISKIRYNRQLTEEPVYAMNNLLRPRYLVHLKVWAPKQKEGLSSFIKYGAITTTQGKTIVSCRQQAFDISEGLAMEHTWKDPSPRTYVTCGEQVCHQEPRTFSSHLPSISMPFAIYLDKAPHARCLYPHH